VQVVTLVNTRAANSRYKSVLDDLALQMIRSRRQKIEKNPSYFEDKVALGETLDFLDIVRSSSLALCPATPPLPPPLI
jgi:hypothetical protein